MPFESFIADASQLTSPKKVDPSLILLYHHLKEQNQKIRHILSQEVTADQEQSFYLNSLDIYEKLGCSIISLNVFDMITDTATEDIVIDDSEASGKAAITAVEDKSAKRESFDWGAPVATQLKQEPAAAFDWSEPVAKKEVVEDLWGDYAPKPVTLDDDYEAFKKSLGLGNEETQPEVIDHDTATKEAVENVAQAITVHKSFTTREAIRIAFESRKLKIFKRLIIIRILAVLEILCLKLIQIYSLHSAFYGLTWMTWIYFSKTSSSRNTQNSSRNLSTAFKCALV